MENVFDRRFLGQIGLLTGLGAMLPVLGTAEAAPSCAAGQCTEKQTFTVTSSPAEVNSPAGPSSADKPETTTATFSKFDTSLGTLTEIDIDLTSTLLGTVSVSATGSSNESQSPAAGETTWDASFSLTLPGGLGFSDSRSDGVSCSSNFSGCQAFKTSSTLTFPITFSNSSLMPSILDLYKGNATDTFEASFGLDLTLSVADQAAEPSSASGGGSATWDPPASDGLTITYFYTPTATVPEPGTLALLGLGAMAGLGFGRKRSKPDA